jgi:hypothetical protein
LRNTKKEEIWIKLAISATGKDLNSMIDPRFGRANYFVIVNAELGDIVKAINNSAAQDAAPGSRHKCSHHCGRIRRPGGLDRTGRAKGF